LTMSAEKKLKIESTPFSLDQSVAAPHGAIDMSASSAGGRPLNFDFPSARPLPDPGKLCARKIFDNLRKAYKDSVAAATSKITYDWKCAMPTLSDLRAFCESAKKVLEKERCLLTIDVTPCYILGDIHGNFGDLYKFLDKTGLIHCGEFIPAKFLFLGDYVDRGLHDIECVLLVLSLKVLYPDKVFLLRGNHEWSDISDGSDDCFCGHLRKQYPDCHKEVKALFFDVFKYLSVACVVDQRILCVHGGIPRAFVTHPNANIIKAWYYMKKPIEGTNTPCVSLPPEAVETKKEGETLPEKDYILFDTLWADPEDGMYCVPHDKIPDGFRTSLRDPSCWIPACSFEMGTLDAFLEKYELDMLVRAHECKARGCQVRNSGKLITVFSTANYSEGNKASVLLVHDNTLFILQLSGNPWSGLPQSYYPD